MCVCLHACVSVYAVPSGDAEQGREGLLGSGGGRGIARDLRLA